MEDYIVSEWSISADRISSISGGEVGWRPTNEEPNHKLNSLGRIFFDETHLDSYD